MFRLDQEGPIARLTLDRIASRNAIPVSGWVELDARLTRVEDGPARLLVVSGAGKTFCAGADLRDFASMAGDQAAASRFRVGMRSALDHLANLPIPTLAWIDGPCFGAGVALALACDLRFSSVDARFAVPPARIGLSYPQEDVHRLVEAVGAGAAARLLFSGQAIGAVEAQRIGLVDVVDEDALEVLIGTIAANVPESLVALKGALRLARLDIRQDEGQDRLFDALAAAEMLAERAVAR